MASFALLVVDGLDRQLQGPLPGGTLVGHLNRDLILRMVQYCPLGEAEEGIVPSQEQQGPKENTPVAFSKLIGILNPPRMLDAKLEREILDVVALPLQPLLGLPTGRVVTPESVEPFLQAHSGKQLSYFWY